MATLLSVCVCVGGVPLAAADGPPTPQVPLQQQPYAVPAPQTQDGAKGACSQAYESSQHLRRDQSLRAAREQLLRCAADTCPAVARTDCVQWLAEVEGAMPSVIFEAHDEGAPVFDVTVAIDGSQVAARLDGRPVELDPGLHTFAFERSGRSRIEQRIIIHEAEKNRVVEINWAPPPREGAPAMRVAAERPVPPTVFAALAVAGLGLVDFAVAGAIGLSKKSDLEASGCAPFCSADEVRKIKTSFAVADIGLAVSVAAVLTGGVLFFSRPERSRTALERRLVVQPMATGVRVTWSADF